MFARDHRTLIVDKVRCLHWPISVDIQLVCIDLPSNQDALLTVPWLERLSTKERSFLPQEIDFTRAVKPFEMIQYNKKLFLPRLAGRLAAKLALSQLSNKAIDECEVWVSQQSQTEGQPIATTGNYVSISHSDTMIIGAASTRPIGVDIQAPKTFSNAALKMAFNNEANSIERCLPHELTWCIKEAFLKTLGIGIFPYIAKIFLSLHQGIYTIESQSPMINRLYKKRGHHTVIMTDWWQKSAVALCQIH